MISTGQTSPPPPRRRRPERRPKGFVLFEREGSASKIRESSHLAESGSPVSSHSVCSSAQKPGRVPCSLWIRARQRSATRRSNTMTFLLVLSPLLSRFIMISIEEVEQFAPQDFARRNKPIKV